MPNRTSFPLASPLLLTAALLLLGGCSSNAIDFSGGMNQLDVWRLDLDTGERIVNKVEDMETIRSLLDKLDLEGTHACGCDHTEGLTLYRDAEKVDVTICSHCFQIQGGADYDMPKGFYEEYKKLLPPEKSADDAAPGSDEPAMGDSKDAPKKDG